MKAGVTSIAVLVSALVTAAPLLLVTAAQAQTAPTAAEGIAQYRALLADGNTADLW